MDEFLQVFHVFLCLVEEFAIRVRPKQCGANLWDDLLGDQVQTGLQRGADPDSAIPSGHFHTAGRVLGQGCLVDGDLKICKKIRFFTNFPKNLGCVAPSLLQLLQTLRQQLLHQLLILGAATQHHLLLEQLEKALQSWGSILWVF